MTKLVVLLRKVCAISVILLVGSVQAQTTGQPIDATAVLGMLQQSMQPAISALSAKAISWLGALATLQFFITNYSLLKTDADLQTVIAKMFGAVAWVGIVIFIINNGPQFIGAVGDQFFGLVGLDLPSPGSIVAYSIGAASATGALAIGVGAVPLVGDTAGMLMVYIALAILAVGMYFAFKIFMLQLELGLIVMLSPLSFSLLGINTLKDQGIAPFKSLLSLAYRIILLTVILSAFGQVSEVMKSTISGIDAETMVAGFGKAVSAVLAAMGAYLLLCYLVFKSDSIASTLASGGTSMGTGDIAQAAAAGAAMGAAVASGGATAAGVASSAPASMRDFMGSLTGGGSVRNASSMGSGAEPFRPPTTGAPQAAMSVAGGSNSNYGGGARGGSPVGESTGARPAVAGGGSTPTAQDHSSRAGGDGAGSAGGMQSSTGQGGASQSGASAQGGQSSDHDQDLASAVRQSQLGRSIATGSIGPDLSGASQDRGEMAPSERLAPPGQAQGSGLNAGIGGDQQRALSENLGKLVDHLSQTSKGPVKPRLRDRIAEANRHMERESGVTHVQVNTSQTD